MTEQMSFEVDVKKGKKSEKVHSTYLHFLFVVLLKLPKFTINNIYQAAMSGL